MPERGIRISEETYKLLLEIQKASFGRPAIKNIVEEAVKLLAKERLKQGEQPR